MQVHIWAALTGTQSADHPAAQAAVAAPADAAGWALGAATGSETLLIACTVLGLIALAAVSNVTKARRETRSVARLARTRSLKMRELLRTLRVAENIAGIGVWQYNPGTCDQQWSDGLKRVFGIDPAESFVDGDAETLLFANDIDLIGRVMEHKSETEPFTLRFDRPGLDGIPRAISVQACNLFGSDGTVQRVVAVVRDETEWVQRERHLVIARAEAIDEARHAKQLAATDALTGLANRRSVLRELDRMVLNARAMRSSLTLVMFDIDHFKRINDTHGHLVGDKVLQRVAALAEAQASHGDLVGRVGGEEFVWVVPGTSERMARILSERLRQAIASSSAAGDLPAVTISLGYASIQGEDSALSLLGRADGALSEAKHSGRNRVRMAA
ncbi:diguanylate cyclase [Qipengyuania sp. ASV99]|uniref:GGDEF domain-containing protein n=1 Tax=Qipengyuania sp. ASV99 TaxID=3399681 RepID=UPI003A4C730C